MSKGKKKKTSTRATNEAIIMAKASPASNAGGPHWKGHGTLILQNHLNDKKHLRPPTKQEYKRKQKGFNERLLEGRWSKNTKGLMGINGRLLEDRELEHEYKRKQKGINNRLLEGREMEALTSNRLSGNMAVKSKTREVSKPTATGKLREIKAGRDYKKRRRRCKDQGRIQ